MAVLFSLWLFAFSALANPIDFWAEKPKRGANFFNEHESQERFRAGKQFGLQWIRLTPSKWKKQDLAEIRRFLDIADREGLKVVLTFLDAPGRLWSQHNGGKYDCRIWSDFAWQEKAIRYFSDLARDLKNHPALAGLNPINEPAPEKCGQRFLDWYRDDYKGWEQRIRGTPQDLNLFYSKLVKAVRGVNADLPVILDTGFYATPWAIHILKPIDDAKVLYSFHSYEPYAYSFQKGAFIYPGQIPTGEPGQKNLAQNWDANQLSKFFQPIKDWQAKHQIPDSKIVVGEFGVMRNAPGAAQYLKDSIEIFNHNRWHWAFYSFREDNWAAMDYELGTKKPPYHYWKAIERKRMPDYQAILDKQLAKILQVGLNTKS